MSLTHEESTPFWNPFFVSLLFGLPLCAVWYFVAIHVGLLATIITIGLGVACGFGARISGGGYHPALAATLSTLALIALTLSVVTIRLVSSDLDVSFIESCRRLLFSGQFTSFSNACVEVAGKTFYGYPIALLAAYKVSDPD